MAWRRRILVATGWVVLLLVIPFIIGDRFIAEYGEHWWTNLIKMGPFWLAFGVWLRRTYKPRTPSQQGETS